ncbi:MULTISPECIES: SbmA/BacA-like family transporter [Ensifer]|jgi:vitamin B12/bleomycin/antimicrobial peptide transport system ATP-binding/permease protein|uniref:SbmA/BacA-like family transporter n=2 Tax=Ensifer TaxID=106591 RepID=A0ABY8HKA2_ENSAD|nr:MULTISPECIES: SbmA/BacA-like family transporter [Ensifer]KQX22955.1 ABC transporter [Ensifer sp. Root423]SFH22062.1 putative ATP-binding cassette transporter [Ensifer sp. OV372]ANK72455.1 ABC transporter [Ensifer adhaerens]KDP74696.1 ABC transporter [Ensifer adhaerens]KQZ58732.1 ABC transporter [Ensifer sp. Root558]
MDSQPVPIRTTALRFARAVRMLLTSEVGGRAKLMFAGLIALLFGLNGLNVVNNYVGRNFMTAIAERQMNEFIQQAVFYVCVFAVLTVTGVIARFVEERLALLWREFMTRRAVDLYLEEETYYRVEVSGTLSNPDQRISEDIQAFTVTTLSYIIMLFSSTLTVVTFSGVLWSISPLLFVVAVFYAACGSYMTIVLGRPLIGLNYERLDREANLRSSLMHLRENAEAVMVTSVEGQQKTRLLDRLDALVVNILTITAVNRNLAFFTSGYNWMIQIIPDLIIAPAFMRGEIEFGVITQSGAAFAMLVGAFSLIVRQFNSISNFAVVVSRLSALLEAIEESRKSSVSSIELVKQDGDLAFDQVTLGSAVTHPLLRDLSLSIPMGTPVLISGPHAAAGAALFRATAGIPTPGTGRIERPESLMFLPQRPYLPPGPLRQYLLPPGSSEGISDSQVLNVLRSLGLDGLADGAEGLEKEQDRDMSLGDQQLLALAKVLLARPRYVFLDRIEATLGREALRNTLSLLRQSSITCINNGEEGDTRDLYGAFLDCREDGSWTWKDDRT